jgi:hypothetical protein
VLVELGNSAPRSSYGNDRSRGGVWTIIPTANDLAAGLLTIRPIAYTRIAATFQIFTAFQSVMTNKGH